MYIRKLAGLAATVTILLGCSTSSPSSSFEAVTTLPPEPAKNPTVALDALAKKSKSIDYSRLSISHDGIFAVVLKHKRNFGYSPVGTFSLWQWDGNSWVEVTSIVANLPGDDISFVEDHGIIGARLVTTYDYTMDGINDFLVSFDDSQSGFNHPLGGILSYENGEWEWKSFKVFSGDLVDLVAELSYDPSSRYISGRDSFSDGIVDLNEFYWDSSHSYFNNTGGVFQGD